MQVAGSTDGDRRSDPTRSNATAVLVARVLAAVGSIALLTIAAQRLDVGDFGLVASVMAGGALVNTAITFGTDTLITRSVAADADDTVALVRASARLQVGASLAVAVAAAVAVASGAPAVIAIEALALVPLAVVTVASAVVRGSADMRPLVVAASAGSATSLMLLIIGFAVDVEPWVPIGARAVGSVVVAVVVARAAVKRLGTSPRHDGAVAAPPLRALLRRAAPFAGMVVLAAIGTQAGVLLVEFGTDEPAGGYGVGVRLFEAARLVPAAVVAARFPAMVGQGRSDGDRTWSNLLVGYAVVATVGLIALADVINDVVFDDQPSGGTIIRVLALAIPLTVARLWISFEAIAADRERHVLTSAVAGTAAFAAIGVPLANTSGAVGVAWAQTAGVAVAVVVLAAGRGSALPTPAHPPTSSS